MRTTTGDREKSGIPLALYSPRWFDWARHATPGSERCMCSLQDRNKWLVVGCGNPRNRMQRVDRDRRLAIGLPIFWAMIWFPTIAVVVVFLRGLECKAVPANWLMLDPKIIVLRGFPNSPGCVGWSHHSITRICWILLLTYDVGAYRYFLLHKHSNMVRSAVPSYAHPRYQVVSVGVHPSPIFTFFDLFVQSRTAIRFQNCTDSVPKWYVLLVNTEHR